MRSTPATRVPRKPPTSTKLRLNVRSSTPLYEQVKDAIRQQIASGALRPGDRIPTLRQLSKDLKIAYATIGRGIRALVEEGVLDAKTARGTTVAERRTTRRGTIGLLGFQPLGAVVHESHYYKTLLYLLQETFVSQGQAVIYDHQTSGRQLVDMFDSMRQVDGVVLLGVAQTRWGELDMFPKLGVPAVIVSHTLEGDPVPCVDSDNEHDTFKAVQAMQKLGHRHIAFVELIEERGRTAHRFRSAGYRSAMEAAGLPPGRDWYILDHPETWARHLLALRPRPTAIMLDGVSAFDRLFADLKGTDLEPGKGLLVATYDENLWGKIGAYSIEHMRIDQPLEKIAARAVEMVLGMLQDSSYHPTTTLVPSVIIHVSSNGTVRRLSGDAHQPSVPGSELVVSTSPSAA